MSFTPLPERTSHNADSANLIRYMSLHFTVDLLYWCVRHHSLSHECIAQSLTQSSTAVGVKCESGHLLSSPLQHPAVGSVLLLVHSVGTVSAPARGFSLSGSSVKMGSLSGLDALAPL